MSTISRDELIAQRTQFHPDTLDITDVPLLPGGLPAYGALSSAELPVRVRNHGPVELIWKWDSRRLRIPTVETHPNGVLVPYMMMVRYMGDPRAFDIDRKRRHRFDEYTRLKKMYGIYENTVLWNPASAPCACTKDDNSMVDISKCPGHIPIVTAHALDTDEQIITVIDDPEGRHARTGIDPAANENDQLRQMVAAMSSQLQNLTNQLADQDAHNAALIRSHGDVEGEVTDAPPAPEPITAAKGSGDQRANAAGSGASGPKQKSGAKVTADTQ